MRLLSLSLACFLGLLVFPARVAAAEPAAAAALVGKWIGTFESTRGRQTVAYVFKLEGNRLTGMASSDFTGEGVISDIKLDQGAIAFVENFSFDGTPLRFNYTGKVSGDEMQLKRVAAGVTLEQVGVAKRVKADAPATDPAPGPKAEAPAPAR